MTPYPATLEANLLSFAHRLRAADLLVSPQEVALALGALAAVDLGDRDEVRLALQSLFATSPAEQRLFERLFEHYWRGGLLDDTDPAPRQNPPPKPPRLQGVSLLDWQAGEGSDETVDTQAYSAAEVVAQGDAAVQTSEVEVLSKLVRRLVKRLATRPSRRWTVAAQRRGHVDLRRTLRRSLAFGGVPVELRYKTRATGKTRVVFVFDVSGSMMVHSGLLLQLAYAFVRERRLSRTEVFGFSTELYPLTTHLQRGGVAEALRAARLAMPGRSGGTKIGASLTALLERYGQLLDDKTILIVNSDGWDTGELDVLARAMRGLKERTRHIIWLNPLAASPGYEPTASGMRTALPFVDVFAPSHNLSSLVALERRLGKL